MRSSHRAREGQLTRQSAAVQTVLRNVRLIGSEITYGHQRVALSFALPLLGAGIAAMAHALVPGVCETTAGDIIRKLHSRLERRPPVL